MAIKCREAKKLSRSQLAAFVIFWSIVGFPILALITNIVAQPSTVFSVALRSFVVALSVILIVTAKGKFASSLTICFFAFWLCYSVRLYVATFIMEDDLSRPAVVYWIWAIGVCFVPAVAMIFGFSVSAVQYAARWVCVSCLVGLCIALLSATTVRVLEDEFAYDIGRLNIESLNPISLGHFAATGVIMGSMLMTRRGAWRFRVMGATLFALGVIVTALANSRGPVVALFVALIVFLSAGARWSRLVSFVIGASLVVAVSSFAGLSILNIDDGLWARFAAIGDADDASSFGRVLAYQGALSQFLGSPVFGDGLEEKITGFYPHNILLEAFMTTGLIGGMPFLILLVVAIRRAWVLTASRSEHLWLGLLLIQYTTGAMFSGSIYTAGAFWVLIAVFISREYFFLVGKERSGLI